MVLSVHYANPCITRTDTVFSTISDQNLILVRDKDTTYDILTTLKNYLSPDRKSVV